MNKSILYILFIVTLGSFCACEEDLDSQSIFNTETPEMNDFDIWLRDNFVNTYNIDFKYKMEDIESDMDYNLIPTSYENSIKMAKLVKFLWLESYDQLMGSQDFMKTYGPKVIHLIGSPAYYQSTGAIVLGTAEGGIKVTLYNVNAMQPYDIEFLNYWYFKTMHHEFAHILHQTINYPTDFNLISAGSYQGSNWINISEQDALELGFVSSYASMEAQEDFVEVIAIYVTNTAAYWREMLANAGEGRAIIEAKLAMVKEYLANSWNFNLDELRQIVQDRSKALDQLDLENL